MPDFPLPLRHEPGVTRSDEDLAREASNHFAQSPALQVIAELIAELRARKLPWWTPTSVRGLWTATDRMGWLDRRPDVRQQITSSLTGLMPKAARGKSPDFQGELIDSTLEAGDTTDERFDAAYDPRDLVVYGPAAEFWSEVRRLLPWDQGTVAHQDLLVFFFKLLLNDKSSWEGVTRKPILSVWELRSAIPSMVWQTHLPLEIRAAIDDARLRQEKAGKPFLAVNEMTIATPKIICASLPLHELQCVLDAAERAMGLGGAAPSVNTSSEPKAKPEPEAKATEKKAEVIASTLPPRNAEKTGPQVIDSAAVRAATPRSVTPTPAPTRAASSQLPPTPKSAAPSATSVVMDEASFDVLEEVTDANIQPNKR